MSEQTKPGPGAEAVAAFDKRFAEGGYQYGQGAKDQARGWFCHGYAAAAGPPREMTRWPDQPLIIDAQGVQRFRANAIVRYILDNGGIDLNHIGMRDFSADDQMQFAQLIGYSLSGYGELSYVTDEAYERVANDAAPPAASAVDAKWLDLARCEQGGRHDWQVTDDPEPTFICVKCKHYKQSTREGLRMFRSELSPAASAAPIKARTAFGKEFAAAISAASAAPKAEPIPGTVDDIDDLWRCPKSGKACGEFKTGQGMVCSRKHECDGAEPTRPIPPTPDDGRSDAELLQRLDEWPKSLAVPPTGLTMTLRTPSVQHEAAARLRELLAEREHTGERIERAVTAALSGDYIGVVTALSGTDALLAPAKTGGGK